MNATHTVLTNALVLFVHITHRYVGGFGFCQLWKTAVKASGQVAVWHVEHNSLAVYTIALKYKKVLLLDSMVRGDMVVVT